MFEVNFFDDADRLILNLPNPIEIQKVFGNLDTSNAAALTMDLMMNHMTFMLNGVEYQFRESKNQNLTTNPTFSINYRPRGLGK